MAHSTARRFPFAPWPAAQFAELPQHKTGSKISPQRQLAGDTYFPRTWQEGLAHTVCMPNAGFRCASFD